jgi:hypothetical protein
MKDSSRSSIVHASGSPHQARVRRDRWFIDLRAKAENGTRSKQAPTSAPGLPPIAPGGDKTRFDWVIRKRRFVSFFDPRDYSTRAIVDVDQTEAIDTKLFAFNDDLDDTNDMIDLLRRTVERQTSAQLSYLRKERLFFSSSVRVSTPRRRSLPERVRDRFLSIATFFRSKQLKRPPI